ncbi:unnamed protein product [Rotaria magnacalcarata]|uniref:Tektin n=1 Tax=Rotaria magnacalcarata TaxID=392030 RepID=A0A816P254_9BILA|nr:unnamed protein product [Rotaria magnacalcarata]
MRKARYLLDRDLKEKFTAQSIDEHALDLNLINSSLYLKKGITHMNPRSVSEPFWEEYSDENIKNAETQRLNADQLHCVIERILKKKRAAHIKQAIERTRQSIKNTEKAIRDKEPYLKLTHTRLDIRHKRPSVELVYDTSQKRLIEEIREIECEIQKLQERLDESHVRLRNFDRDKLVLEKDIETKTITIFFDEAECHEG